MKSLPEQCREWLKADLPGVNESELLRLSTEDDSPGHEFAADFRIGFRYGWPRGAKAERARTRPLDELVPLLIETLERECIHYECEDCFYSCPKALGYCGNDFNCNCNADKNQLLLARIRQAVEGSGK